MSYLTRFFSVSFQFLCCGIPPKSFTEAANTHDKTLNSLVYESFNNEGFGNEISLLWTLSRVRIFPILIPIPKISFWRYIHIPNTSSTIFLNTDSEFYWTYYCRDIELILSVMLCFFYFYFFKLSTIYLGLHCLIYRRLAG